VQEPVRRWWCVKCGALITDDGDWGAEAGIGIYHYVNDKRCGPVVEEKTGGVGEWTGPREEV
jgi:hypothetical protein